MSISSKILPVIFLAVAFVFAQDDSDFPFDEGASSYSSEFSETSDSFDSDEQTPSAVGTATATSGEWEGFQYEEMGLTQWEFQEAKEKGISREKLTQLVEMGVRPSEYLQQPWVRLGVSEQEWLEQRTQGLEDSDIDRSYRNRSGDQNYAYLSLLVPSLYQWYSGQNVKAIWIDAIWVGGVGTLAYLAATEDTNVWMYALIPVIGAHVWSFIDAFFGTQWDNNPDANRFSFGIAPTLDQGVASMFMMRF
ncbi:MAG: hypothetical protein J6Q11_08840 [Fibrobacteraceae bacterium]|nr:hypothetical protein [Fibrobacteraceae bacterium]